MSLRDHPAVVGATLGVAIAGLFFSIGYNLRGDHISTLEAHIKTLELTQQLKLPQLLESLKSAAEELEVSARNSIELKQSRKSLANLRTDLEKAIGDKEKLREDLAAKQKILDSFLASSEVFTLTEGAAKNLAGYGVTLGLLRVSATNAVTVLVNNVQSEMYPGSIQTIQARKKNYRLILDSISFGTSSASFTFIVE